MNGFQPFSPFGGAAVPAGGGDASPAFGEVIGAVSRTFTAAANRVVSVSMAVGSGGFVALAIGSQAEITEVSDSQGNTYSIHASEIRSGYRITLVSASVSTALTTSDTITITGSGNLNWNAAEVFTLENVSTGLDASNTAQGFGTSPTASAMTSAETVVIGIVGNSNSLTPTATDGTEVAAASVQMVALYKDAVAAGSPSIGVTFGSSVNWTTIIGAFK